MLFRLLKATISNMKPSETQCFFYYRNKESSYLREITYLKNWMTPRETSFIYIKKISDWYFTRYRRKYECKNWLKKTIFTILVLLCFFDIAYLFKCSITPSQTTLILIIFLCKHVIKRYIRICEIHTFLTAFFDHSTQQFQPFRY